MIPKIEQILRDLNQGNISLKEATSYINQHMALAEEGMRDAFAAAALASLDGMSMMAIEMAIEAYEIADAMMVARKEKP